MSKLRLSIAVLCILSSVICALWAVPPLTPAQKDGKAACDHVFNICFQSCGTVPMQDPLHPNLSNYPSTSTNDCQNDCISQLAGCYGKIGIQAKPGTQLPKGVTVHQLQTASLAPKGSRHLPNGLQQINPTASPTRTIRQPNAVLQSSPTPTPITHEKKKGT